MNDAKVLVKFTGDTKNLDGATSKAKKGLGSFKGFAKGIGASIAGIAATAAAAATAMLVDITKQSLKARADLEQNLGGVETLFGKDAEKVVANAKKAYQTAGVSANEYMQGVTSFSASLLQSLSGDTAKAADIADMAFRDMSDNANKFGTDMQAIQNAYQGFAKQNYTMLDNLKLGYGGTKTEMQRLLADATKLTGVKYDISNLSDVYNAIHAVQEEMGVTGTTAKEATQTISGSMNAAKAAWQNFLSGTIDTKDLVKTFITAAKNIVKELLKIIPDIAQGLVDLINGLIPYIPKIMKQLLPVVFQGIVELTKGLVSMLPEIVNMLLQGIIMIINALAEALPDLLPQIVQAIVDIIPVLIDNLPLFIEAGVKLIVGLAIGIVQAIPQLLALIPKLVISLVKLIAKLPGMFFNIAKNTMLQFGNALVNNFNKVYNKVKGLPKKIITAIKTILTPGALKTIALNFIAGLWNGIKAKFDSVVQGVKNLAAKLPKAVRKVLGIESPSTVMFELGSYTTEGFINGIDSLKGELDKKMVNTFSLSPSVTNSANTHLSPHVNVVNNIEMRQDPLGQMVNNIKTFSGGAKNDYNYGKA
jgi:phage-related protein